MGSILYNFIHIIHIWCLWMTNNNTLWSGQVCSYYRYGRYWNTPSVCLSVTFIFSHRASNCFAIWSRNCRYVYQVGVCCIVFDIDWMLFGIFMKYWKKAPSLTAWPFGCRARKFVGFEPVGRRSWATEFQLFPLRWGWVSMLHLQMLSHSYDNS